MLPAAPKEKSPLLTTLKEAAFFVAIYLYFTGFVYIYYFYEHFGISLNSIEVPFYYFFVYSYNVITSLDEGAVWGYALRSLWVVVLVFAALAFVLVKVMRERKWLALLFCSLVFLFPALFSFAWKSADLAANEVRNGRHVKVVTLVFKKEALETYPKEVPGCGAADAGKVEKKRAAVLAAAASPTPQPKAPKSEGLLRLLAANSNKFACPEEEKCLDGEGKKIDKGRPELWLLAETKDHFYVIYQPWQCIENLLPSGYVYEVSKSDISFAEITVR